jgi:soluble lytic murein transglycosylase
VSQTAARRLLLILVPVAALIGCGDEPSPATDAGPPTILDQAFSAAEDDPVRAIELFERSGVGAELERARLEAWARCLERIGAASDGWRRFLDDRPPQDLADRARLELIDELIEKGSIAEALDERRLLSPGRQADADAALLTAADDHVRYDAARRLAVSDPRALRSLDRALDDVMLREMAPESRLERARSLRQGGAAERAAAELRRHRWRGELEAERRREIARCELENGAPLRALRALPEASDSSADELVLRARAHRNRAWHLWPERSARAVFERCVDAAGRVDDGDEAHRRDALELELECATEAGRLERAVASWWSLERSGWRDGRRGWLGRRLGVALAQQGDSPEAVRAIARALPEHARALRFWNAAATGEPGSELESLAKAPIPDLYASWARDDLGSPAGGVVKLRPDIDAAAPPASVRRLLDAGARRDAALQWQRLRRLRKTTPAEALGASELAAAVDLPIDAIRWLRAGFPELGTIHLDALPGNVVTAYLPLHFRDTLESAAREFRIEPWLIAAIARQESGFAAHARSPRGAVGVLQLVPSTARGHARALGLELPPDLADPATNIRLGAREIAYLVRRFGAIEPALAAYNGGETRTRRWWRRQPDRRLFTESMPVPETYNYIRRVVFLSEAYRLVYREQWRSGA